MVTSKGEGGCSWYAIRDEECQPPRRNATTIDPAAIWYGRLIPGSLSAYQLNGIICCIFRKEATMEGNGVMASALGVAGESATHNNLILGGYEIEVYR